MSEEKRNIIGQLIEMCDVKTVADIQDALRELLGGTIQSMLESELETQEQEIGSGSGVSGQPKRLQVEDTQVEHGRDTDPGTAGS